MPFGANTMPIGTDTTLFGGGYAGVRLGVLRGGEVACAVSQGLGTASVEFEERIGRGNFGIVFSARVNGVRVALKICIPKRRERSAEYCARQFAARPLDFVVKALSDAGVSHNFYYLYFTNKQCCFWGDPYSLRERMDRLDAADAKALRDVMQINTYTAEDVEELFTQPDMDQCVTYSVSRLFDGPTLFNAVKRGVPLDDAVLFEAIYSAVVLARFVRHDTVDNHAGNYMLHRETRPRSFHVNGVRFQFPPGWSLRRIDVLDWEPLILPAEELDLFAGDLNFFDALRPALQPHHVELWAELTRVSRAGKLRGVEDALPFLFASYVVAQEDADAVSVGYSARTSLRPTGETMPGHSPAPYAQPAPVTPRARVQVENTQEVVLSAPPLKRFGARKADEGKKRPPLLDVNV